MILFDLGSIFLAAYIAVVFALSAAAFGRDIFPQQKPVQSLSKLRPAKTSTARSASR
jgi:hypothetical protein